MHFFVSWYFIYLDLIVKICYISKFAELLSFKSLKQEKKLPSAVYMEAWRSSDKTTIQL